VVLAANVVVLLASVLPLAQRASTAEERAEQAEREAVVAQSEFQKAESMRDAKARATTDLDTFYRQVLPVDVDAARRVLQSKPRRLASAHDVGYGRGQADIEEIRESSLQRMISSIALSGSWDDVRGFIYELETAPEFIVIDNVAIAEGMDTNAPLALSMDLSTYYRAPAARARTGTNGR
jgi:hypothetical protein